MALIDSITNLFNRARGVTTTGASTPLQLRYVNGVIKLYDPKINTYIEDGYLSNEQVYAIIQWIIRKAKRVPFYLYEIQDEKALKKYKSLLAQEGTNKEAMITASILRQKALVEADDDKIPLNQWLKRPNPHQSFSEFVEYCVGYRLIIGERFLHRVDGVTSKPPESYPLNPIDVALESGKQLFEIARFLYGPTREPIDRDTIVYSKYFNPGQIGGGETNRGLSPLRAMLGVIQESNESNKQSIKQMQNSGPVGAIFGNWVSNDGEMMPETVAGKLRDDITKAWLTGQKRPIVTTGPIKFEKFGLSPVELGILDTRKFTFRQLCDGYGLPVEIFNMGEGTTFNNKNEAKRSAIIDAVLPEVFSLRDDFNELLKPYLRPSSGKQYYIDCDPSDLPELQEDMEKMVKIYSTIYRDGAITPNEYREGMKWGIDDRAEVQAYVNNYVIPSSGTPYSLMFSEDPLDVDPATQTDIPQ